MPTAKKNDESEKTRDKNLEIALSQVERDFGKGAIMRLGDDIKMDVPTISTGALSLDIALGVGGVPRGRIVEIYGPESSGKTTICLHVIANAQKAGGLGAFIDTEHALDPNVLSRRKTTSRASQQSVSHRQHPGQIQLWIRPRNT